MKITLVSSLLGISFYWFYLCNHIFVVSGLCLDDQKSLLLQLKNNLTFIDVDDSSSSRRLSLWNASHDCCRWMGVGCDKEGHVTSLDLSVELNTDGEFIFGGFDNSSVLFNLQHLQKLNLANNYFKTLIPSGFSKLKNLTHLNLSNVGFKGQIPIEISHLTRLVTLDLSSFSFGVMPGLKLESPNLQRLVQNLTNIRQLYLDGVNISVPGHEWWSPLLSLKELSMSDCGLSGPLDPSLARLKNLSVIVLDGNNLSSPVPQTFANFKNLKILRLGGCELTGTFPQKIFNIKTLSVVDISWNYNLNGPFPEFPLSGSLQSISASYSNFVGAIPLSIGNMRNLSLLDLKSCGFNGSIPNSLSNLTKLSYLDLSFNKLTGPLTSFSKAKKLTKLCLSFNDLSGIVPSSHFEGMHNLVDIDLSYNSFTGRIPSSLFTLPSLQRIQFSQNQFSQVDEFINVTSSRLKVLDISDNNITGPFPVFVFQLNSLTDLFLSSNKFNGSVLPKIHSMNVTNTDMSPFPNIEFLSLASCNLKTIPDFLKNCSTLSSLDLSDNQIEGTVPNWIWKLPNLLDLNISHNLLTSLEGPLKNLTSKMIVVALQYNQLRGPIPLLFKYADILDFSSNNFSSFIPPEIGDYLSLASFLSLSNNTLHGNIPYSICNASHLQVLDLSINNISGTIPSCLMMMNGTLKVLNLKKNNLSGPIPDTVILSRGLETLNLNGNLLDGPIPKSLTYCSKLEVLDLGSNQFIGSFPCFLKEIPTLRVLVLRNNKFQGSIRCSKANKTWEMLQILDISFNNFSGKLPGNYFTTWKRDVMHNEDETRSKFIEKFYSEGYPYQDSMTVIGKGQQMKLVKILKIFTSIDFSSNHFEGHIPQELMVCNDLHILNLSNNALSGKIPSSISNMRQLESLDLSQNSLSGEIPMQLASLSFLSYLNLSFNHLVGKIPTGTQLQSFSASSFEGNDGLYGPPLTKNPDHKVQEALPQQECARFSCTIDWNFISVEVGLVFGHAIIFGPLLVWKPWRVKYWQLVHKILCRIFPQVYIEYITERGQTYEALRWRHQ